MVKKYKCNICKQIFYKNIHLRLHYKIKHNEHINKYTCSICNYSFLNKKTLNNHLSNHNTDINYNFNTYFKNSENVIYNNIIHNYYFTNINSSIYKNIIYNNNLIDNIKYYPNIIKNDIDDENNYINYNICN